MQINEIKTELLIPYENNPRLNDSAVDGVVKSIQQFGFKVPIVIDKNNVIIAGHTRLKAALKMGLNKVPCILADDLDEQQIKAYRLVDNKVAERATWDFDMLEIELNGLKDIQVDMEFFGFDFPEEEIIEDDFNLDEALDSIIEPVTKLGDIITLGKHRLMCGDSTEIEDIRKLMNGEQADLLLTDPPYNVDYQGKTKDELKIINDKMSDDKFRLFLFDAFKCADEVMKEGAAFYIWHADSEGYNFRGACRDVGWLVRQCLIWNKSSLILGRQDYHWKHEPCLYGWKEGAAHHWTGDRKQTTVLDFDKPTVNAEHPTMKPVKLFAYQINNNTLKNSKVLDVFAGSGTTIIACEQGNRIGYCMELDPKYCDVIVKRWELLTGLTAIR